MDEEMIKQIAAQLRKPEGEYATKIADTMNVSNRLINLNTIDALDLQDNDKVLELGMGNGFFVENILAEADNIIYTGCDYSQEMVDASIKLNEQFVQKKQASFYLGELENLPVSDAFFNKVFTINTLYFWENKEVILKEIKRVLALHGQFFIAIRPRHIMEKYTFTQYNFKMFEADEVEELLKENGFNHISSIVLREPNQTMAGESFPVETLIIVADVKL